VPGAKKIRRIRSSEINVKRCAILTAKKHETRRERWEITDIVTRLSRLKLKWIISRVLAKKLIWNFETCRFVLVIAERRKNAMTKNVFHARGRSLVCARRDNVSASSIICLGARGAEYSRKASRRIDLARFSRFSLIFLSVLTSRKFKLAVRYGSPRCRGLTATRRKYLSHLAHRYLFEFAKRN